MNIDIYSQLKFEILWQCGQKLNINTGINDQRPDKKQSHINQELKITCSPNPSSEWIVCDLKELNLNSSVLQFTNYLGQNFNVPYNRNQSQLELNVSNLECGMYILSLWSANQFYTSKIIIQR